MLTVISIIKEEENHHIILSLLLLLQEDKISRPFHQVSKMSRLSIKALQLSQDNLTLKY
jgi:hypothetical protein